MKRLLITVGSSLFHSATWRPDGPFAKISGYRRWTEEPFLCSPRLRSQMCEGKASGRSVEDAVENLLFDTCREPAKLDDLVALDGPSCPSRYCAEISTLFGMQKTPLGQTDLAQLLEAYDHVELIAAKSPKDESHAVARHLRKTLSKLTGYDRIILCELDGTALRDRMEQFEITLRRLGEEAQGEVHIVVSGGYKAYATVAARHLASHRSWRTIYLHEHAVVPIIENWKGLRIDNQVVEVEPGEPGF